MKTKRKEVLEKASAWPEEAQDQLAEVAREIESGLGATYQATAEELHAIDDADRSGHWRIFYTIDKSATCWRYTASSAEIRKPTEPP